MRKTLLWANWRGWEGKARSRGSWAGNVGAVNGGGSLQEETVADLVVIAVD